VDEEKIGSISMSAKGLRRFADATEMLFEDKIIGLPVWKCGDKLYFQVDKGSGAINLKGND
jgi:hypothetical protein